MKKTLILMLSLLTGVISLEAQTSNNIKRSGSVSANHKSTNRESQTSVSSNSRTTAKTRKGTWELGGNLGMSFGDYTNINISPQIGYRFNQYFSLGGGVSYNYYDDKDYDYKLNYMGMNIYTRFYPIRYIVLSVQPEFHRRWGSVHGKDTKNEFFSSLLIGAGAILPVSPRSGLMINFYYDVSQNKYSPYGDNIGYSIGYTYNF